MEKASGWRETLQWRHNEHDGFSNHQPHHCLLNHLIRRRSKKTSKLRVTGLCVWNSPGTGEFPAQMASNAENVSIWWRHHGSFQLNSRLTLKVNPSIQTSLYIFHDDVIKWKYFPRYWPFVRGIHRSPVNSPQRGQWRGALIFSLICAWINGWVNNRDTGDLRRHSAHYDVILMLIDSHIFREVAWCIYKEPTKEKNTTTELLTAGGHSSLELNPMFLDFWPTGWNWWRKKQ